MKTTLAILLLSTVSIFASHPLDSQFLHALNMVEASGREGYIVGDNGKALGPFQIHRSYWEDAGVHGCYSMVTNRVYAMQVVTAYLNRYAPFAVINRDYRTLARVHNGGQYGHRKIATKNYWLRVKQFMKP